MLDRNSEATMVPCQFFVWVQGSRYHVSVTENIGWMGKHNVLEAPYFQYLEKKEISEKSISNGLIIHQFIYLSHGDLSNLWHITEISPQKKEVLHVSYINVYNMEK